MAKKKVNSGSNGLETPPNGASQPVQRFNNLSDLAGLKENMPDATEPLKNSLAECIKDDEVVIDSLFSHYSGLRLNSTDRKKLIEHFNGGKKEVIDRMTEYFVEKHGLQNVISKIKEGGGSAEFVRQNGDVVNVMSNREVLGFYKEILEKKKPSKKQAKDLAEIDRIFSEVLNLDDVEVVAPGAEKNSGKIISPQAGAHKNMNKEGASQEAKPVGEKDRQRFQQILREFSDKFSQQRADQVERMRRLTGMHVGLAYDIEAIRKQAESVVKKFQDEAEAERALKDIFERGEKGSKKKEPVKDGFIASYISGEIKNGLGENEKAFVEDTKELEIKERKVREIVSDYAFGQGDREYEARIDAAVEKIKDSGVKLRISPELLKKKYIEQKRQIINELANSIIKSEDYFKNIIAMKKGEKEPDADLKRFIMSEIRQMIAQVFEWKEKPRAAGQPPENIPVVEESQAAPKVASEKGLAGMEEEMQNKFNKDEIGYRDEQLGIYERRLRKQIEKFNLSPEKIEKFRSQFIASMIHIMRRGGMTLENATLLEKYLSLKLPVSFEPETSAAPATESAGEKESPKAPSKKTETRPKSEKEKAIWDIVSKEVDWVCDMEPESEYTSYFEHKFDKDKADYRKQGLSWKDADLIAAVFRADREAVKSRILAAIQDEMKKAGKDILRATLKEVHEMARKNVKKEVNEYFQKAVRGGLGLNEKKDMETEIKFTKEQKEELDDLTAQAIESYLKWSDESVKTWGNESSGFSDQDVKTIIETTLRGAISKFLDEELIPQSIFKTGDKERVIKYVMDKIKK